MKKLFLILIPFLFLGCPNSSNLPKEEPVSNNSIIVLTSNTGTITMYWNGLFEFSNHYNKTFKLNEFIAQVPDSQMDRYHKLFDKVENNEIKYLDALDVELIPLKIVYEGEKLKLDDIEELTTNLITTCSSTRYVNFHIFSKNSIALSFGIEVED